MLPASVRRVVQAAPQTGLTTSLASTATKAATPYLGRFHQRRYSSSSSSKPSNGADQDASAEQPQAAQAPATRGRKRKAKTPEADAWTKNLPSVPNTTHMTTGSLSLSSFFSLHRPISVTEPMPKPMSNEHFATIFAQPSKSKKAQDTISAISSTIDQLETPMAQLSVDSPEAQSGDVVHTMGFRHADGTETNIHLRVDAMSGEFFPFRPPPAPEPNAAAAADNMGAMQHEAHDESSSHRVYKAVFTIEETTQADGQIRILAHSPRIVETPPRSFIERLAQRQLKFDEAQGARGMYAISVRRQRKLRMKKKKYKKLMRRTRNLRRKLDRT